MRNRILYFVLVCTALCTPVSCKKFIQQQQENAIVYLVTNGSWRVTRYIEQGTNNITDSFLLYKFQFNKDGTVYGERFGQQSSGTWSADVSSKSITSVFPGAVYPVILLNHTWTVTDSYTDSVAAKTAVSGGNNLLSITKN